MSDLQAAEPLQRLGIDPRQAENERGQLRFVGRWALGGGAGERTCHGGAAGVEQQVCAGVELTASGRSECQLVGLGFPAEAYTADRAGAVDDEILGLGATALGDGGESDGVGR